MSFNLSPPARLRLKYLLLFLQTQKEIYSPAHLQTPRLQEANLTKTYLTIYCSSEGAPPSVVVERLTRMGFRPIAGPYDFEYEWDQNGEIEEMIQIANRVHATLKGCKVFFKLETVPTR